VAVIRTWAGLEAPAGGQLTQRKGEDGAACGAQLQMAVELGKAQGTGGARAAEAMGCGMGLQGVVGVGEGLAVHCKELQSHGIGADETGYPDRPVVLSGRPSLQAVANGYRLAQSQAYKGGNPLAWWLNLPTEQQPMLWSRAFDLLFLASRLWAVGVWSGVLVFSSFSSLCGYPVPSCGVASAQPDGSPLPSPIGLQCPTLFNGRDVWWV